MKLPVEYRPLIQPFDHQRESLVAGWQREFFGYLLEMGLGKSRVAIDDFCLNYELGHVDALMIVAPKSVYSNWTRDDPKNPGELLKWLWGEARTANVTHTYRAGRSRTRMQERQAVLDRTAPGPRILAINVEAISSTDDAVDLCIRFLKLHRVMLVVDESTIIKDKDSIRTKLLTRLGGLAKKRRILTGSPSTGSPTDVWGQFEFLSRGLLGHRTFTSFQTRYCLMKDMRIGSRVIRKEYGTQNLEELRDIMKLHSIRKRKTECLDLPPKIYEDPVHVELTDEQEKAYAEMKRTAMAVVQGQDVTTTIVMTQMMRLHQIACGHISTDDGRTLRLRSNRAAALLDVVEKSGERKAVVWCNYREDALIAAEALANKYGREKVVCWTGGEHMDQREKNENEFQNGGARFMVATQSAGARGRTWTAATLVVYYSNSYDLELREQSEDRTHRIGQTGTVVYVDLLSPNTVDEKIIEALREKKSVVRTIQEDGFSRWI